MLLVAAAFGPACAAQRHPANLLPPLALSPCHLDRLTEEVLCGIHDVYEDRASGSGRRLSIHVAVLPALRRAAEPDPLVVLAGGPGQGARGYAPLVARHFRKVRRSRDVVLVDLRGTGASAPLACPVAGDELAQIDGIVDHAAEAARCREALDADPRHYTHAEALADLDEIRRRLGYTRVNLWGGSWGTRAALLYALTYPHAVRSVVLDGAVPLSTAFPRDVARNAERAFDRLVSTCAADAGCAAVHPQPRALLATLLARLDRAPAAVQLRHPRTGETTRLTLSRDTVAELVRVALYTPADATRLFRVLAHANSGDFGPLAAQFLRSASVSIDSMAIGQTMSVLCSEDVPAGDEASRDPGAATFLRAANAIAWSERCRVWPRGAGIAFDRSAVSSVPALIFSGEHDPATPPDAGAEMGRHFVNHLHVVVPGAAHNTSFTGCVPDLIADFIARGSAAAIDRSCASRVRWPGAVLSDAGNTR
jgi:pimeloyl-ACP methyl ester carboxylesterase